VASSGLGEFSGAVRRARCSHTLDPEGSVISFKAVVVRDGRVLGGMGLGMGSRQAWRSRRHQQSERAIDSGGFGGVGERREGVGGQNRVGTNSPGGMANGTRASALTSIGCELTCGSDRIGFEVTDRGNSGARAGVGGVVGSGMARSASG